MENNKKVFCHELVFGAEIENQPFVLEAVGETVGDKVYLTLSDRSGTANGCITKSLIQDMNLSECLGKVFNISAVVLPEKRTPLVVIKAISEAKYYLPSEMFSGLSEKMVANYKELIQSLMARVKNVGYSALLNACLSDENLNRLAQMPASHGGHASYVGGCLAATAVVPDMALYEGVRYAKLSNQLYTSPPNWDLLVTAGLLHTYGRFQFYDANDPFKKSVKGVRMNYFPILQSSLERVILEKEISLSDEEFGDLINVLQVAVSGKTSTKAVSKDGTILRHVISLYRECDMMDYSAANHMPSEGEEFFYDRKINRYLINRAEEEGVES